MKHLRKSILTLLALTLFGGAGAWAQGPTNVTQFTTDMIASWEGVNENVTLADLQALGFVAVDASVAQAWTGAPQNDNAMLVYGFNEGNGNIMSMMFNHGNVNPPDQGGIPKGVFYDMIANGEKFFYTGAPNQAIELTKEGANQWTLGQAPPDYDLELQVEYYEAHALKNIPAGWTVKVNGVDKTAAIDHDSLMITETDTVTLVPAGNPRRVKSVTLEEEGPAVQTITVAGVQLNYVEGENWVQTAQRNPGVIEIESNYVNRPNGYFLVTSSPVSPTSTYDPSLNYWWEEW